MTEEQRQMLEQIQLNRSRKRAQRRPIKRPMRQDRKYNTKDTDYRPGTLVPRPRPVGPVPMPSPRPTPGLGPVPMPSPRERPIPSRRETPTFLPLNYRKKLP